MTRSKDRIWTPGRIAALLVIAVVIALLLHSRGAHPPGWAKVPGGAHAGQLDLKACTYPTEAGDVKADCGTLVVRENRANPKSRLIAVPVTRIRSSSKHPAEPIFRLEGGPGRSNMTFPFASRYTANHDLVLVGYRGVDGSARLDCPEVTSVRRHTADLVSDRAVRASADAMRRCAERFKDDGYDLAGYSIAQRVDDLEDARRAMGYKQVDLLSESFGTRVALIYAWRHPQSVRRSVMVGVNPPGHFVWQPQQTDAQLRRYAALGAGDSVAAMHRTVPKRWGPFPIHRGNVELASFFGLMDASSAAAPISAPMTLDAWRAAAKGDASGLWFQSLASALLFPHAQVWGDSAAMGRIDAATAAAHFHSGQGAGSALRDSASRFLWAGGALAAWPATPDEAAYDHLRDSDVETLLISGELDGATPAQNATKDLLPHLPNGHQVLLEGLGHTTDFWNTQVGAGNHLINTYMDSGRVDSSRYAAQKIDFTPSTTQTKLAKLFAGAMIALAVFAALSLAWLATRRRPGRITRIVTRTLWAPVIGLGGWFAAVLVALIAFPSVPVDAELLITGSMAIPVALASYFAWRGPTIGLVAAIAGALTGAWFGLECATGMLAVATTLAGAVAGTNLALIAFDIVSESSRASGAPAGDERRSHEAVQMV
jgi:pimeloyl-ACP methyl ester carboxylesterase